MTRAFVTLIKPSVSFVSKPRRAASVLPPYSYIPLTRFHSTVPSKYSGLAVARQNNVVSPLLLNPVTVSYGFTKQRTVWDDI